jgi:hypothetical protein
MVKDAGLHVVLEQHPIDSLKGTLQSGDLFHDLGAVLLFLDHADHTVEVPPDCLESIERRLLVYFFHVSESTPPGEGYHTLFRREIQDPD